MDTPLIQTVTGPIPPERLGWTLVHEHVLVDFIGAEQAGPHRYDVEEVLRVVLPYLERLRQAGGQTLVECTPAFLGRDPRLLRRLSEASGVQILTNTGLYKEPYLPPYAFTEGADELAQRWIREAEEGIEGTGIRPAFIKIAANEGKLLPVQEKILRAAARTHRRTGLPIHSHTTQGPVAMRQLEVLEEEGVEPSAFVWVHADAEKETSFHEEAARRGAWVEFDAITRRPWEFHLELVRSLWEKGYGHRLLLSQDAGWYHVGEPGGGKFHPYEGLLTQFVPVLRRAGLDEEAIESLLVVHPRLLLTPRR